MKNKKIKEEFYEIGYDLKYLTSPEGRAWHIRKHGTTEWFYMGDITFVEEWLYNTKADMEVK